MFPSREIGFARLYFVLQQAGVVALFWLSYLVVDLLRFEGGLSPAPYVEGTVVLLAAALLEFFSRDPETRSPQGLDREELAGVSHRQVLFVLVTIFGAMVMLKDDSLSRVFLVTFFGLSFPWILWTNRYGYRVLYRVLYRSNEKGLSETVVVGEPDEVARFCSEGGLAQPPGTRLLGCVPVPPEIPGLPGISGSAVPFDTGLPILGRFEDLRSVCEHSRARALLLLGLRDRPELFRPVSRVAGELGVRAIWIDDVHSHFGQGFQPYHTGHYSVVSQLREPLEDPGSRALKRCFDLFASALGIALVLPPAILFVAILQAISSPGPLFYRQERSGRNGERFRIFKFRSMHFRPDAAFEQAKQGDSRLYRGGALIRKFSIDELPQLLNVFRGEMSLVGPRPHPIPLDDRLSGESDTYRLRNLAKPGMTGLSQARGWRGETVHGPQIRNRVRLDLFYIQHWRPSLDLRIMVETVVQVFRPPRTAC